MDFSRARLHAYFTEADEPADRIAAHGALPAIYNFSDKATAKALPEMPQI